MLSKFRCGHVGRENDSPRAKVRAFIRVAEIRRQVVEDVVKDCPDCIAITY